MTAALHAKITYRTRCAFCRKWVNRKPSFPNEHVFCCIDHWRKWDHDHGHKGIDDMCDYLRRRDEWRKQEQELA